MFGPIATPGGYSRFQEALLLHTPTLDSTFHDETLAAEVQPRRDVPKYGATLDVPLQHRLAVMTTAGPADQREARCKLRRALSWLGLSVGCSERSSRVSTTKVASFRTSASVTSTCKPWLWGNFRFSPRSRDVTHKIWGREAREGFGI